ncbi:DNA-processing protein DprA [Saccharomonospora saliphila]|uniref:DNA-processing protein DprA n=1 Tax=Saccharomonospora saliphila TaxID=369829 RepID=UPI00037ABF0E|nr:DNA-processing protein DprA [Saccharomonospora saliphila]
MTSRTERGALVALLEDRPSGVTWRQIADDVGDEGSAVQVYRRLFSPDLFTPSDSLGSRFEKAAQQIDGWQAEGLGVHTLLDATYPRQLRDVLHMPPIVFTRGTLADDGDRRAVAIVGSRRPSRNGVAIASRLAAGLGERGFTIVSGGAAGIDSAAHSAALAADARTVAVVGTGIRRCYPPENRDLFDRVAASGMILSQFWPDAPPSKHTFPMRNAVMSGYVTATVVVEASEHSGTRIQARNAVEHGRPVLFTEHVVRATAWARGMVDQPGVHVVTGLTEVLDVLAQSEDSTSALHRLLGTVSR